MVLANMSWSLWIVKQVRSIHTYLATCSSECNSYIIVLFIQVYASCSARGVSEQAAGDVVPVCFQRGAVILLAVAAERDFSKWKLRFDISLLAIIYTVITIAYFD